MSSLKRSIKSILTEAGYRSGLITTVRKRQRGRAVVLAYHRVLPADSPHLACTQSGMYVTDDSFKMQMEYLAENYRMLTLDDFIVGLKEGFFDDRPSCLITFDDGWIDNYDYALPIMKENKIPGVIFLATDFVGTNRSFWTDTAARLLTILYHRFASENRAAKIKEQLQSFAELLDLDHLAAISRDQFLFRTLERFKTISSEQRQQLLEKLKSLLEDTIEQPRSIVDWEQVNGLKEANVVAGSHTSSHCLLTEVSPDQQEKELVESRKELTEKTGGPPRAFCYPNGNYNQRIAQTVAEAGYEVAFTVLPGLVSPGDDPFSLPRICVHQDISYNRAHFASLISGVFK